VRELLELEELVCWRRAGEGWVVRAREERRGVMAARSVPDRIYSSWRSEGLFFEIGEGFETCEWARVRGKEGGILSFSSRTGCEGALGRAIESFGG
jgi:hypothetical protein